MDVDRRDRIGYISDRRGVRSRNFLLGCADLVQAGRVPPANVPQVILSRPDEGMVKFSKVFDQKASLQEQAAPSADTSAQPKSDVNTSPKSSGATESPAQPKIPAGAVVDEDLFLSPVPVPLTDKEKKTVETSRVWREQAASEVSPIQSDGGATQFVFGLEQPSVVCSPLNVTDVELQRGESVQSVLLGDTSRWRVDVVISAGDTPHLVIKPLDVGLTTSMVVTTDRRTYHLRLRSHRTEYVARANFAYPEDTTAKIGAQQQAAQVRRDKETIPETEDRLSELDFNYHISGKALWKPVRVYNDGRRTVLEMPATMSQMEAPSLLVLQGGEQTLVNYRVQNRRYIVDRIFTEAILIAGVGRHQEQVTVKYLGPSGRSNPAKEK